MTTFEIESEKLSPPKGGVPLVVDLDGSLVATDTLVESVLLMARHKPAALARLPLWLLKGKAHLKTRVADHVTLNAASLPYRAELLQYIREQKADGRPIVLATAADHRIAHGVAEYLNVFDRVLATDETTNLSRHNKLKTIQAHCDGGAFDYVGNSHDDLPVWQSARHAVAVSPDRGVLKKMGAFCTPQQVFTEPGDRFARRAVAAVKALRPHQWVKNVLLGVPLVASHGWHDWHNWMNLGVAFASFSLAASSVYVVNDLLDLEADRLHRTKRNRPFAAAAVPLTVGLLMAPLLLVAAFAIAALVSWKFLGMVAAYVAISTAYSFVLKQKLLVDVFTLAGLYTFRILAGGVAIGVTLTPWLLAFSMFLFTSLAFAKRFTELRHVRLGSGKAAKGRGYKVEDLEIFTGVGPGSGYMAVLVLCLYINSDAVRKLYKSPETLWLACPVILYWVTRLWFLAQRDELPDDPVKFALKDKASFAVAGLVALIVLAATLV